MMTCDTPLHLAAGSNVEAVITALLEAGADMKARNKAGQTAWDRIQTRKVPPLEDLTKTAVYTRLKFSDSLIQALKKDATTNAEIITLINAGADVDEKTEGSGDEGDEGWTPLHYAADSRDITIIKALVNTGADTTIGDKYGDAAVGGLEFNDQLGEAEQREAESLLGRVIP